MNTVEKVINVAVDEVGYLEKSAASYKKNPDILDEKTRGAGTDNFTKYGRDMHKLYPAVMDFPAAWCDAFVDWCFQKAYGVANAKGLLCGNFDDYTVASAQLYKNKGSLDQTPQRGAQVFFTKNGQVSGCYHTGLVYQVDNNYFYTVEGNTSGGSSVVANGGGVAKKKYSISAYKGKVLFGHPKYEVEKASALSAHGKTINEISQEVIAGKWGNGEERSKRLTAAGYDIADIQKCVNAILSGTSTRKSYNEIAKEVIAGKWGIGSDRKKKLEAAGYDYSKVQETVNKLLKNK